MTQETAFLTTEGNAWLERNRNKLNPKDDPVLDTIEQLVGFPIEGKCLEIGCSNGWRLEAIKKRYGIDVYGIDPSIKAVEEAREKGVIALRRTANLIPYRNGYFDVVIYGFCLYLCDRSELLSSMAEGDRVLKDKGIMIIYDFAPPTHPFKRAYRHKEGLWSYHQDYGAIYLANPAYEPITKNIDYENDISVEILRKDIERAWPCA